ncbi:MAG: Gfo/Idh/MocA family oxidoreductase [Anaerolineae bacterium]|nr:Gfo/Idh/MocA family oxidoreductase [Anaerolineae bacterium]
MTSVAVVGVGSMGRNHVRVYSEMPGVELVAVVDANAELANQVGRANHVPTFDNYVEMIEDTQPEAVSIVVPTSLHYQVAKDILELGCHVLVEKPIASTIEQAEDLVETAHQLGSVLMVGHIERYNPAIIELKRRLGENELGRIFQINARRLGPFPTRIQDVGVIMDLAPHDLDIMRYLVGGEVCRVHAETKRVLHETQDDMFAGLVRFEDGILGVLEINWLTPTKIRELSVTGERGMFRVNYITQDLYFYQNAEANGESWSPISLLRGVSEGMVVQYPIKKREPLRAELEAFISAVQEKSPHDGNGYDAQVALELVFALMNASASDNVNRVEHLKPSVAV